MYQYLSSAVPHSWSQRVTASINVDPGASVFWSFIWSESMSRLTGSIHLCFLHKFLVFLSDVSYGSHSSVALSISSWLYTVAVKLDAVITCPPACSKNERVSLLLSLPAAAQGPDHPLTPFTLRWFQSAVLVYMNNVMPCHIVFLYSIHVALYNPLPPAATCVSEWRVHDSDTAFKSVKCQRLR